MNVVVNDSAEEFKCRPQLAADREAFFAALDIFSTPFANVPPAKVDEEVTRALAAVRYQRRSENNVAADKAKFAVR